jgi:hypothetical protein
VCNLKRAQQALVEQLVRFQPGNVLIVEKYPAPGRGIETGDGVEQGGLAGPVGADQAGDGTLGNFERNMTSSTRIIDNKPGKRKMQDANLSGCAGGAMLANSTVKREKNVSSRPGSRGCLRSGLAVTRTPT